MTKLIEMSDYILEKYDLGDVIKENEEPEKITERRKSTRLLVEKIMLKPKEKILVRSKNIETKRSSSDRLVNISEGGLQIESNNKTRIVGDMIELTFKIGIHSFCIKGEIKNTVELEDKEKVRYGIEFNGLINNDRLAISQLLGSSHFNKHGY